MQRCLLCQLLPPASLPLRFQRLGQQSTQVYLLSIMSQGVLHQHYSSECTDSTRDASTAGTSAQSRARDGHSPLLPLSEDPPTSWAAALTRHVRARSADHALVVPAVLPADLPLNTSHTRMFKHPVLGWLAQPGTDAGQC